MRYRCAVGVLLVLSALAGYAAGARPVQAQPQAFPFSIGDNVTFNLPNGTWRCRIEEIRGTFARCGEQKPQDARFGDRPQDPSWVNVGAVQSLSTAPRQR